MLRRPPRYAAVLRRVFDPAPDRRYRIDVRPCERCSSATGSARAGDRGESADSMMNTFVERYERDGKIWSIRYDEGALAIVEDGVERVERFVGSYPAYAR